MGGKKSIKVRLALEVDIPAVFRLLLDFHTEQPLGSIPLHQGRLLSTIVHVMQSGGVLLAERNGDVIGTMGIAPTQWWFSESWYLSDRWTFVQKGARRSTAGRELLKAAKTFADNAGLMLLVAVANLHQTERKNLLYRRLFTPIGEMFIHGITNPEGQKHV